MRMNEPLLIDSNIIIYSTLPDYSFLRDTLRDYKLHASVVSKVEVLGYAKLTKPDTEYFNNYFNLIQLYHTSSTIAEYAIKLRQLKKISLGDALIAGTALAYDLPLMTRNDQDFTWIEGLSVINPFIQ